MKFYDAKDIINSESLRNSKVVVWGATGRGEDACQMLEALGVTVDAFCDNNSERWGEQFCGKKVLSLDEFREIDKSNLCVLIVSRWEGQIRKQLIEYDVSECISLSQLYLTYEQGRFNEIYNDKEKYHDYLKNEHQVFAETSSIWNYIDWESIDKDCNCIIFCMPPKTGNYTMENAMRRWETGKNIWTITWHSAYYINELCEKLGSHVKIKIVTGVREPISQNISVLYQLADSLFVDNPMFWNNDPAGLLEYFFLRETKKISDDCIYMQHVEGNKDTYAIQNFFEEQFQNYLGIDLFDYPFDYEKGYSVIETERFEILIYQLEKLNDLQEDVVRFLEIRSDAVLESSNEAANKYYNLYYKDALENIEFSQEYFDWCFGSPYVNHFYSKAQVAMLKEKWRRHIRK